MKKKYNSYSEVAERLRASGILERSTSWDDYETAKHVLFGLQWYEGGNYEQVVRWISDYLNI